MEFVGPGVDNLSVDYRIGVDVMTTETTCLSSIWKTDEKVQDFYEINRRPEEYRELNPGAVAYYDGVVCVDLSAIRPMIAMPFHPSNAYTIDELNANLDDILADVEKRAAVSLGNKVPFTLRDKVRDGKMYVDLGVIAGYTLNEKRPSPMLCPSNISATSHRFSKPPPAHPAITP